MGNEIQYCETPDSGNSTYLVPLAAKEAESFEQRRKPESCMSS